MIKRKRASSKAKGEQSAGVSSSGTPAEPLKGTIVENQPKALTEAEEAAFWDLHDPLDFATGDPRVHVPSKQWRKQNAISARPRTRGTAHASKPARRETAGKGMSGPSEKLAYDRRAHPVVVSDQQKYRALKRNTAMSEAAAADGRVIPLGDLKALLLATPPPDESHSEARARLVAALLKTGWLVKTMFIRGQRPRLELQHPDTPYQLSFYGHGVAVDDFKTLADIRGLTVVQLIQHCEWQRRELHDTEARRSWSLKKARAEANASEGIAHEVVMKGFRARIARFDKDRARPPKIPMFCTPSSEAAFWAKHSVLDYFGGIDSLEDLENDDGD